MPDIYYDNRGSFHESFNLKKFEQLGVPTQYAQDNDSFSKPWVFRGLHLQRDPYAQGKLIRVIRGAVVDFIIDLREGSPNYLSTLSISVNDIKKNIVYIPPGFAHGFMTLQETNFSYKCTSPYNKESETGIRWNDPDLEVGQMLENFEEMFSVEIELSEKDKNLPSLKELLKEIKATPQYSY